jgi:hypothetical protein
MVRLGVKDKAKRLTVCETASPSVVSLLRDAALLPTVLLDEVDKELERRGHAFVG